MSFLARAKLDSTVTFVSMSVAQLTRAKTVENAMFTRRRKFATALTILSVNFARRNLAMESHASTGEFVERIRIRILSSANAPLDFMGNHARFDDQNNFL